ncbi:MAG: ComEC/Rec2 family competence protein [Boseongicola sp.]
MRIFVRFAPFVDAQRGHLFPWAPVLLGLGVGVYFALPFEPSSLAINVLVGLALGLALIGCFTPASLRFCIAVLVLMLLGVILASVRAHSVAEPRLNYRYYGPVEGRIVGIDRSRSDAVRLTLDRVILADFPYDKTPTFLRVSLHGEKSYFVPAIGQLIVLTGHLSPPAGPVEPGGFDFQRQAWFKRLGAIGYTRTPTLLLAKPEYLEFGLRLTDVRLKISASVRSKLPGRTGAFAAAISTGDRSGMDQETLEALRASNLAHLLAISGLHMGLLTGFVFVAIRTAFAFSQSIALHWPTKKLAAVAALLSGAVYLLLSGGNVATERAFVMVAVMFGAVLLDRRAITIRAVAVAAMIVLILRPESLLGPGFQMSFAATTALVGVFGWLRDRDWSRSRWPYVLRFSAGVALSSAIAGLATAPFAAAHFNQIPHFGLLANVISVPVMGALVIPGAVIAAIFSPIGFSQIGFWIMKPAIDWILLVAETVSGWPGALSFVPTPGSIVLPLLALGGLIMVLWQGRARIAGAAALIAAVAVWGNVERPTLLVSETGSLIGVMRNGTRALSKSRGESFAAESWLENDGDAAEQAIAFERPGMSVDDSIRRIQVEKLIIFHATGKRSGQKAVSRCAEADIVVVNVRIAQKTGCDVYDKARLARTGALAIYSDSNGVKLVTARQKQGARLWSQ